MSALVITGWNCISPYGIGKDAFLAGIAGGNNLESELDSLLPSDETAPTNQARVAASFDIASILGKKGTRLFDRLTGLSIATVDKLLKDNIKESEHGGASVVLGSSQGSLRSISGFTRETLRYDRPDYVNPALFPNTVMNCAAGQTAIWHGCRGPNVTVSAGHLSGISALRFSITALRQGYTDLVLAGAVEEFTGPNAWAQHVASDEEARAHAPFAEGCAMFTIETATNADAKGRKAQAEILCTELATYNANANDEEKAQLLGLRIKSALNRSGVSPEMVKIVCQSAFDAKLENVEQEALKFADLNGSGIDRIGLNKVVGNPVSAACAFQLAVLLARLIDGDHPPGSCALLTAIDNGGSLGMVLIRSVA